ncbi:PqiC family protein [Desulfobulbus alkaliphilus]|uniref:PqiC family protein n=1 Tax=Desulfobulbus alkaliphilus TaxID=869814 RepID=UPI001964DBFD|nr:PqiC family protein [Desulfobulbus alkaliphilus]MBM9538756.1 membrane integrity-associated transporter subunit PqiC [Desulfobulbus alkaliphilus]
MKRYKASALFAFLYLAALCFSGCSATRSQPADFYLLSSQPLPQLAERDGLVGVLPVRVPDYLDRPQIVTRTGKNTLDLNEFNRWAEPLRMNITSVLVQNLSHLLGTDAIINTNQNFGHPLRFQVGVEVQRFDGELGGTVILSGRWSIHSDDRKQTVVGRGFSFHEQTRSASYEDYVVALSQAIDELSRVIAEELERIL